MHDSTEETLMHIEDVRANIRDIENNLERRAIKHDHTKLEPEEKPGFDQARGLRELVYGSEEYSVGKAGLGDALVHHYAHPDNRHHPEHWANGVQDMSLMDLQEMLADWRAAAKRHANGSLEKSFVINRERFNIPDQLYKILVNTIEELGW